MKTPISPRNHQAFTLIELLTVIAIIGILAAILIPVVGAVRDRAKVAACQSNLRQVGMAVHMYALDNGDQLPVVAGDPLRGTMGAGIGFRSLAGWLISRPYGWVEGGYLEDADVLFCPSQNHPDFQRRGPGHLTTRNWIGYSWIYLPRPNRPELDNTALRDDNQNHALVMDLDGHVNYINQGWAPHPPMVNVLRLGGHVTTVNRDYVSQFEDWVRFVEVLHETR